MLWAGKLCGKVLSAKSRLSNRKGAVLVLSAFLMIAMMALIAFAVDVGYLATLNSELKRSTDAAALAGAGCLIDGPEAAELEAFEFLVRNPVGNRPLATGDNWTDNLAGLLAQHREIFEVEVGLWDPATRTFTPSTEMPSTVRVAAVHPNAPLFFGKLFRRYETVSDENGTHRRPIPLDLRAESIARYQPRDIALVLDFSASMNDDSELRRIGEFGEDVRGRVEANLLEIYGELGSPSYGNMTFQPQYLTLVGIPPSEPSMPQITVTFRSSDVYATSTKDISNIVLEFSDGTQERFEGIPDGTTSGAFRGTGGNYNKRIDAVWVKSGSNANIIDGRGYGERFADDLSTIKQTLAIDSVPYPYPSGSWNDYVGYVKSSYNVYRAGYRKKYGYMTLINYWLENKPTHSETPDLWKASEEPVRAVKDAVEVFVGYIGEVDTEDRIALAVYNSPSQTALVEHSLTEDFGALQYTVEHRQAGHYDRYTNIGAGIQAARLELEQNARPGAFKLIVLMTDGCANRPSDDATGFAIAQAQLVAEHHWPIVTISLGDSADTNLMQTIADLTDSAHFNVPGGGTVTDYEEELLEVFRRIADHRPLVLVR